VVSCEAELPEQPAKVITEKLNIAPKQTLANLLIVMIVLVLFTI
jgi:hypothetical protein